MFFLLTEYKNHQWMVNGVWNSKNIQELMERRKRKIVPVQRPLQQQPQQQMEQLRQATIQQKDAIIGEKESTIRQQGQQANELQCKLRVKDATIGRKDTAIGQLRTTIGQKDTTIGQLRTTIGQKDTAIGQLRTTIGQKDAIIQEKERSLIQSNTQLQEKDDIIERNDTTIAGQQRVIQSYRDNPHWVVQRDEVTITNTVLGQGGWGEVRVGLFRGCKVAVKRLYQAIQSELYMELFAREMEMASCIRHPNLLQFIGATREGELIIVTELMPTSLRHELERNQLTRIQVIAISIDIITALNYLHLWKPHPIIHRDVSSANILLQPLGNFQFKAKLSDYGSVNLQDHIKTENPGNPVYSAPESKTPARHSPAMDIYSYGILLMEMATRRFPPATPLEREAQIRLVQWPSIRLLISRCTVPNRNNRPNTSNVLEQLEELHKSEFN